MGGIPDGIGVVDLMIGLPSADRRWWANSMSSLLLDQDSKSTFQHAASYMYKDLPETDGPEAVTTTIASACCCARWTSTASSAA